MTIQSDPSPTKHAKLTVNRLIIKIRYFQEGIIIVFLLMKLISNPSTAPGGNKKAKKKRTSSKTDSNHREILDEFHKQKLLKIAFFQRPRNFW